MMFIALLISSILAFNAPPGVTHKATPERWVDPQISVGVQINGIDTAMVKEIKKKGTPCGGVYKRREVRVVVGICQGKLHRLDPLRVTVHNNRKESVRVRVGYKVDEYGEG